MVTPEVAEVDIQKRLMATCSKPGASVSFGVEPAGPLEVITSSKKFGMNLLTEIMYKYYDKQQFETNPLHKKNCLPS